LKNVFIWCIFNVLIYRAEEDTLSSEEDLHSHKNWSVADLHAIDVSSSHFKSLPADVRHDILSELKETRKQSSWGRLHEMPKVKNLNIYSGKVIYYHTMKTYGMETRYGSMHS
jgi:hypothetical protein